MHWLSAFQQDMPEKHAADQQRHHVVGDDYPQSPGMLQEAHECIADSQAFLLPPVGSLCNLLVLSTAGGKILRKFLRASCLGIRGTKNALHIHKNSRSPDQSCVLSFRLHCQLSNPCLQLKDHTMRSARDQTMG